MKMMLLILMTFVSLNTTATTPIMPILTAELSQHERWDVDSEMGTIYEGHVEVNAFLGTLSLNYEYAAHCPEGMACIAALQIKEVTLPLKSIENDACGTMTYTAERNHMPADGTREVLTITSSLYNKCMHLTVEEPTKINYTIQFYSWVDGKIVTLQADLLAETLQMK